MVYQIEISSKFPRELELVINLLWPVDYDEFWQKQNRRMDIDQKTFLFCQLKPTPLGNRPIVRQRLFWE